MPTSFLKYHSKDLKGPYPGNCQVFSFGILANQPASAGKAFLATAAAVRLPHPAWPSWDGRWMG